MIWWWNRRNYRSSTVTFEQLWLRMVENKPLLADPKATVTINTETFKMLLRQAHQKGVEQGKSEPSLFDTIFGNRDKR
jgi:hypothetical protein